LWATYRATGQLFLLNYEAALPAADHAVARTPNYYQPHLTRAWALAGLGDYATALSEIEKARELDSADILEKFVKEMRKWSANSPNRRLCWSVLDKLLQTGIAPKDMGAAQRDALIPIIPGCS
jgi:tetratricopeptide (TPR) repeat protein